MIKSILLDYGGTIDTDGVHWGELLWSMYQRHSVPVSEQAFREAYVYAERSLAVQPLVQSHHRFEDVLSIKLEQQFAFLETNGLLQPSASNLYAQEIIVRDCDVFVKESIAKATPVLSALSAKFPLVLVSNFYGNIRAVLEGYGLLHLFTAIVESAVVGVRKPDPEIFRLGVKAGGSKPEECVAVGDSYRKDIVPAKTAGCQTIWLQSKGWEADPDITEAADKIIHRFSDLAALLLSEQSLHSV